MRKEPNGRIERFRTLNYPSPDIARAMIGTNTGEFLVRHEGAFLKVIASDGGGWEHVSVSLKDRCPTWAEMCFIKSLWWGPEECVIQFHPPEAEYVNNHANCLHLWRPVGVDIPLPPSFMVGVKELGVVAGGK